VKFFGMWVLAANMLVTCMVCTSVAYKVRLAARAKRDKVRAFML